MKYFFVYVTFKGGNTTEFLFKSRSSQLLESQLSRYPNGLIATNKFGIQANNAISLFISEID